MIQITEKMQQISRNYQDISNMLTQIHSQIHSNFELNQWVERTEIAIEDGYLEHEA